VDRERDPRPAGLIGSDGLRRSGRDREIWTTLAKRSGLDERFGTSVVQDLNDLVPILLLANGSVAEGARTEVLPSRALRVRRSGALTGSAISSRGVTALAAAIALTRTARLVRAIALATTQSPAITLQASAIQG
jgi:hypothetical protein